MTREKMLSLVCVCRLSCRSVTRCLPPLRLLPRLLSGSERFRLDRCLVGDHVREILLKSERTNAFSRIRIGEFLEVGEDIHRKDSHQPRLADGFIELTFPPIAESVLLFGRDIPRLAILSCESNELLMSNDGITGFRHSIFSLGRCY